jgi:hypothetical protein
MIESSAYADTRDGAEVMKAINDTIMQNATQELRDNGRWIKNPTFDEGKVQRSIQDLQEIADKIGRIKVEMWENEGFDMSGPISEVDTLISTFKANYGLSDRNLAGKIEGSRRSVLKKSIDIASSILNEIKMKGAPQKGMVESEEIESDPVFIKTQQSILPEATLTELRKTSMFSNPTYNVENGIEGLQRIIKLIATVEIQINKNETTEQITDTMKQAQASIAKFKTENGLSGTLAASLSGRRGKMKQCLQNAEYILKTFADQKGIRLDGGRKRFRTKTKKTKTKRTKTKKTKKRKPTRRQQKRGNKRKRTIKY